MRQRIFVTGIGTGVGKTVAAAVLCEALEADYWKPVQTGTVEGSDRETVADLVSPARQIFPEQYRFPEPLAPHAAAAINGTAIEPATLLPPGGERPLIIEGAGGILVPLASRYCMADLARDLGAGVVLVSRHYLGSINHTLLSIEAIRSRGLPLLGIIYNGEAAPGTENAIAEHSAVPVIGRLRHEMRLTREIIARYGAEFREALRESR